MHRLLTGPLTLEQVTVPIRDLPSRLQGCRIVQLSDFHFDGLRCSPWLVKAVVQRTQALAPDLVALTGDFVTKDPTPIYALAAALKSLSSRFRVVAILGNHDITNLSARKTITDGLTQVGITVLWNEIAYPLGGDFPVVGLADLRSQEFTPADVLNTLPADLPRLVLSHNPDTAALLQPWRVDLQLSGHTHGGQIILPWIGPLPPLVQKTRLSRLRLWRKIIPSFSPSSTKVVRHWEWASGLHQVGQNWLYVNRGLGTYPPGRLFCPPEITEITLVRSEKLG
ncbi:MAG TPA: metallophosphoesterase [Leptolyngbyaceae cyanobacterium]